MSDNLKLVNYHDYCPKCKHYELEEWKEPCNSCLNEPTNINSQRPINFEKNPRVDSRKKQGV